jgi:hypothetical protein
MTESRPHTRLENAKSIAIDFTPIGSGTAWLSDLSLEDAPRSAK